LFLKYKDLLGIQFFVQPSNWRGFEHAGARSISPLVFYAKEELPEYWAY
jgi:hypothetical protein